MACVLKVVIILFSLDYLVNCVLLPLSLEYDKDNPLKGRVYLNPLSQIRTIVKLSARDVKYVRNKDTYSIDPIYSDWTTLVSNDYRPSLRYALLKNSICSEKEFKISWIDRIANIEREPVVERMKPTPEVWQPEVQYSAQPLQLDATYPGAVKLKFDWTMIQDKLQGQERMSEIEPIVELVECDSLFEKAAPPPAVSGPEKAVYFHPSYVDHKCTFALRLTVMVYNAKNECRSMLQTTNDKSFSIFLSCNKVQGYKCTTFQQPCGMNCDVKMASIAQYEYDSFGIPYQVVKVTWTSSDRIVAGSAVRINHMNGLLNNFPLANGYQEAEFVAGTDFNITSFPSLDDGFYGMQMCTFSQPCKTEPDWDHVPVRVVFAGQLVDALPPSPPTIKLTSTTVTTASTTASPVVKPIVPSFRPQPVAAVNPVHLSNTINLAKPENKGFRMQHNQT